MKVEQVEISQLRPHPKNPRDHPVESIEKLKKSIETFGWTNPILVSEDDYILAGHARLKAAQEAGLKTVPVIRLPLKGSKAEAYLVADNRLQEETEWDFPKLKELLVTLDDGALDLNLTGFDLKELEDLIDYQAGETDGDDVPEPPKKAKTKLGDLWILGEHRLLCGDSTKAEDVSRLMAGKKANMVFTDPPYGVSYSKKNTFLNSIDKGNHIQDEIKNDGWTKNETCDFWFRSFEIIRDNLADVNAYYIFGPQIQGMMMMMMMMKANLPYKHVIIWVKNNHVLGRCDYNYRHEPIFFGWTKTHKFQRAGEFLTSVWEVDKPLKNDLHPTMKPIRLIENALLNSSNKNQICLDPFGGSGSTLIACEKLNRKCRMMEIDPIYCDVTVERWQTFTGKKAHLKRREK